MPSFLDPAPAKIIPLKALPENLGAFIEEIAEGLHSLYGPAAAADYRLRARRSFAASLAHPAVEAYAAMAGKSTAGLIMGFRRGPVGEISLLHILQPYQGRGIEGLLVRQLAASLQQSRLETVLFECLSLCPVDVAGSFRSLGFDLVARELMLAPLRAAGLRQMREPISMPCEPDQWELLAECIVDAYTGHPEQRLHYEVNTPAGAFDFVARVAAGNYGHFHPRMMRVIMREGRCVAGILGCPIAPETGFVLQVAVRREVQGQGYGRRLLQELAQVFRESGLLHAALGVTTSSPARKLYVSVGFHTQMPVNAYVWWRTPRATR